MYCIPFSLVERDYIVFFNFHWWLVSFSHKQLGSKDDIMYTPSMISKGTLYEDTFPIGLISWNGPTLLRSLELDPSGRLLDPWCVHLELKQFAAF